ncbi:hypothetical protein CNMCM5793_003959 [Aspergillus hiratsukae]|uniref:Ankyrin repeat protein n=1 Tax=Aspergillus hiratsukae TaxID=1194566 RepID=A0A8H6UWA5_9EURO|nr:hypothetical protein CNMCM5793_003959 [Aspergillus hiratsukae]KAF7169272.1 hypothetical protein CNMCM6106_004203 [Aspergillus hiratsukae]
MDKVDIADSALVLGSPRCVFDPTYYAELRSPEFQQLKVASEQGNLEQVRNIFESNQLSKDTFIYSLARAQQNSHISAVEKRQYDFLDLFLEHGYNINEPINWTTPSVLIRSFDDERLCKWLLEHGADPNAQCLLDLTPLSVAVQLAPFTIIKLLFEHGGSIKHGQLLHYAVRRDRDDYLYVLAFLLDKGPRVNQVMYDNHPVSYEHQKPFGIGTPLHEAAAMGKMDVVDLLISRGADPSVRDARGRPLFTEQNGTVKQW